ncbi:MAG: alkaline phosphatase family protein [Thermoanaerobaculum sp.]|nr:alkaline phosphatase family protein [Thermoanaerobaculum sp.]
MKTRWFWLPLCVGSVLWAQDSGRVVVLGFDGADAVLVEQYLAEGKLPHLAELARAGGYARLTPTVPAQTPVSWATFTTGRDPGGTQIFDFLRRDPLTYMPTFAVAEETKTPFLWGQWNRPAAVALALLLGLGLGWVLARLVGRQTPWLHALPVALLLGGVGYVVGGWLPASIPQVVSRRTGTPFWQLAGEKGIPSTVARIPVTFPAAPFPHGHLLAGLGVPDLRGRIGAPAYYTSDPGFVPGFDNEFSIEIIRLPAGQKHWKTKILGPQDRLFGTGSYLESPLTLEENPDGSLTLATCGQEVRLVVGSWSPWLRVCFGFNPLIRVTGWTRFKLLALHPYLKLYLQPINPDPLRTPPGFDLSAPRQWAAELFRALGPFKTVGWAIDTWAPSEKVVDEQTFMEDIEHTEGQEFRRLLRHFLAGNDRLLVHYFEFTDRVGHILWRALDPQNPAHVADEAARLAGFVERAYRLMDDIVGEVKGQLGPEDVLVVLSDHGFSTWRRSFHINTWLAREGYLALTAPSGQVENLENLFNRGQFWPNVDWGRTRAYHLGLGGLYINLAGRERFGIVAPGEEYEALRRELAARLEALVDPSTGAHPVSRVFLREQVYKSFDPTLIPDLIVTTSLGYRISWQSALGGMPEGLFEDNARVWSGDHCTLDPALVPGVLFVNRPLVRRDLSMVDVYPTLLKLLRLRSQEPLSGHAFL